MSSNLSEGIKFPVCTAFVAAVARASRILCLRILARSGNGKDPVVSITMALVFGTAFDRSEYMARLERRTVTKRLSDICPEISNLIQGVSCFQVLPSDPMRTSQALRLLQSFILTS